MENAFACFEAYLIYLNNLKLTRTMRVTDQLSISVFGDLTVNVGVSPGQGYVGTSFTVTASWDGIGVGPFDVVINWGDGVIDTYNITAKNISKNHAYGSTGGKTITVSVNDEYTAASGSNSASIIVASDVQAGLSADKTSGNVPLTVNFICAMSGGFPPYDWVLDYGDGNQTSAQKATEGEEYPGHTYNSVGSYTALLTVTDSLGLSVTKSAVISAGLEISTMILKAIPIAVGAILIKISSP